MAAIGLVASPLPLRMALRWTIGLSSATAALVAKIARTATAPYHFFIMPSAPVNSGTLFSQTHSSRCKRIRDYSPGRDHGEKSGEETACLSPVERAKCCSPEPQSRVYSLPSDDRLRCRCAAHEKCAAEPWP